MALDTSVSEDSFEGSLGRGFSINRTPHKLEFGKWAVFLMVLIAIETSISGDSFEGSFIRGLLHKPDPLFI